MKSRPDPCTRAGDTSNSTYDSHARSLHSRAKTAYADWLKTLNPDELRRVRELKVDSPPDDNPEVGGHSPYSASDIADTPLARIETDIAATIDTPAAILAEEFGVSIETAERILAWHTAETNNAIRSAEATHLQIIVGGLLATNNPKLSCAGLAFAANLAALNGLPSQREYAKQNHISPEAISKMVRSWSRTLNLNPSVHQKSPEACKAYAKIGKQSHWRNKKFSATHVLGRIKSRAPQNPSLN